jgi:hypothetical protein
LLLALAGCAAPSYEEPLDGPRARARFSTDTTNQAVLQQYGDNACRAGESEVTRLRGGVPGVSDAVRELYVVAGKPFYGLFIGSDQRTASRDAAFGQTTTLLEQCGVPFSFTFEPGADYEVAFRRAACRVEIWRIQRDAAGKTLRAAQSPAPMDGAACGRVFEKRRFFH